MAKLQNDADSMWVSNIRLLKANFGESYSILIHTKVLKVFVEAVLRYGLPSQFLFFTMKTAPKAEKRTRIALLRALKDLKLDGVSSEDIDSVLNATDSEEDIYKDVPVEDLELMRSLSAATVDPFYDIYVKNDLCVEQLLGNF
jgi:hypothetical protein